MSSAQIREEINREVALLPLDKEQQVLEFVRSLRGRKPSDIPSGHRLARFKGILSNEARLEMESVIEEGCEQVDEEGWM